MSAYNFQKQFVPKIESGEKRSTIRMRRKNGYLPRPGDLISLYTGMRTKQCRLIRKAGVKKVTPIQINTTHTPLEGAKADVVLGTERLTAAQVHRLAVADGFDDADKFADFFHYQYGDSVNAFLIEWDR